MTAMNLSLYDIFKNCSMRRKILIFLREYADIMYQLVNCCAKSNILIYKYKKINE